MKWFDDLKRAYQRAAALPNNPNRMTWVSVYWFVRLRVASSTSRCDGERHGVRLVP